ncbi:MAG: cytochrome c [Pseudomonadota bacterium]
MTFRVLTCAIAAATGVATALFAAGHTTPEGQVVAARNAQMTLYGYHVGLLGNMAKGEVPYDADLARSTAEFLAAMAGASQDQLWVPGTEQGVVDGSRAKADIWTDPDGFAAELARFSEATQALANAAGEGLESMQGALGPVGRGCGSCHDAYRGPRN